MQKTIMVTGATSGIGQETARQLAERGARVIVVGRSDQKARDTVAAIRAATGSSDADFLLADFAALDEVRGLARAFKERYGGLDVLVNNAGAVFVRRQESNDGYEMTFAVNHLAPFLLTNLLLETMPPDGRIVTVASDAHEGAALDFDDLQLKQDYSVMKAYGRSKLANVLFAYELGRRLAGSGMTSNALHPGFVSTGMGSNNVPGWLGRLFQGVTGLFARDVVKGAETVVYLANSADVAGVSGQYFMDKQPIKSSPASHDAEAARRLWELSAAMTELPDRPAL